MRCPTLNDLPSPPPGKIGWPWTEECPQLPEQMPDGRLWPRISIVTPSYNQGEFIEETIRSVLLQGHPDLEYIVIDAGSTDGSVGIIKKYEPWLAWWVSERDRGQANALNKGFAWATGDVYAYLNSDDLHAPGILRAVAESFAAVSQPDRHWVASTVVDFSAVSERLVVPPDELGLLRWVTRQVSIHQPGTFWSAAIYKQIGGFDEAFDFAFDRKFFMELIARLVLPQVLPVVGARFRLHNLSKTGKELSANKNGSIFVSEFVRLSDKFMPRLTAGERRVAAGYLRQQCMSRRLRECSEHGRLAAFWRFLWSSLSDDVSVVRTRFFWGTLKNICARKR
jgi:glycosyltransferase involved in cell wall biosynthesis